MLDKYLQCEPDNIWHRLALMVLYDQLPRNIYRGTAAAYQFDSHAQRHAKHICDSVGFDGLPLGPQLALLLTHIHSEHLEDHQFVSGQLQFVESDRKCSTQILE